MAYFIFIFHVLVHFDQGWSEKRSYIKRNRHRLLHMYWLIDSDLHGMGEFQTVYATPTYHHRKQRNNYADNRGGEESVFNRNLMHKSIV